MQLRHIASLTGLFAALCTTPAAAQTFSSLPGQGPLEDKQCQTISGIIRPGNIIGTDQAEAKKIAIEKGWAHIMQNDCKMKPYLVDKQGNATAQDNTAPFRLGAKPPAPTPPPAATIPTTSTTGWATIPGLLPAQVDPASIRPIYVPMPSTAAWREEGCIINGIKMPIHAGLILDNRTFWHVAPKCKLEPMVTVTRDTTQPLNGPASRFDSATELLAGIDKLMADLAIKNNNPGETAHIMRLLHGGPIIPLPGAPAISAVQVYPGKAVVVDESLRMSLGMARVIAGHMDSDTALIVQAPAPASTATALTGEWWHQPGLLATSPQGNITAGGRDAAGNCRITINGQQVAAVAPDRLIIPDNTRLMYVDSKCDVKLVFNVPAEKGVPEPPISTAGGGFRNPGNIILPGKPNVNVLFQPSTGAEQTAARVIATLSALAATNPNAALAARALVIGPALAYSSIAVLTLGGGYIIYKHIQDMNEKEAQEALAMSNPTIEDRIKVNKNRPYDSRSEQPPPGNCSRSRYDELEREVTSNCKESGTRTCTPTKPPFVLGNDELLRRRYQNLLCANSREKILTECHWNGDRNHRQQLEDELRAVKKCNEKLGLQ